MYLTADQKYLLETSLRVAAEKFRENSNVCINPSLKKHSIDLAEIFRRQASQAEVLLDLFEGSESVEVHV